MKKLILIVIFSVSVFANINWHTYKEAFNLTQSGLLKKDIFVMVVSDNCRYCHKMLNSIKSNREFQRYMNSNYYNVLINSSKDFMPIQLDTGITPSYFILDSQTMEIKRDDIKGFMPLNVLKSKLR